MRNRILLFVRSLKGADIRINAALIRVRMYITAVGIRRWFNVRCHRWIDKGLNNFYAMIKNHKK